MGTIREFPESVLRAYSTKGKASAFAVNAGKGNYIYNARAYNNSGSTINVGLAVLGVSQEFDLYAYTASNTTYTKVTSLISGGTNIFTGTNNDGFAVQFKKVPGLVGLTISSANSGGTIVYNYWNGSAFTSFTPLDKPANYNSTGDNWIAFAPPQDWVKGGTANEGLNQNQYTLFVQSTTAPAGAVAITNLWVAHWLELYQNVPNNAAVQVTFPDTKPYVTSSGAGIIPYFSTANAANQVGVYLSITGG